jgi:hypothetical protein
VHLGQPFAVWRQLQDADGISRDLLCLAALLNQIDGEPRHLVHRLAAALDAQDLPGMVFDGAIFDLIGPVLTDGLGADDA